MSDKLKVLDLFSGIGGFSLGLERTSGFETVAFCEIDPFCQKVLRKHWPDVQIYEDVRELAANRFVSCEIDVITGGFPCQDISIAGPGVGITGERSGLWCEIARLVEQLRPQFVIVENVSALLNRGLGDVLRDLATVGYDAQWHCIPAANIGSRHIRDRVWIIAYTCGYRLERSIQIRNSIASSLQPHHRCAPVGTHGEVDWEGWASESSFLGSDDEIPDWVDRVKALGNSVVPDIPEIIGKAILRAEMCLMHDAA